MGYTKNKWVDQVVERPKTYEMTNNADGSVTLIDSFGLVSELGTPVNADNMNHIEEGIAACDLRKYDKSESYEEHEWVTGFVDNEKSIYKSLVANNLGNPLTDATKWARIDFSSNTFLPYITNCVLSMPENGVTFSGLTATVKTGIKVLIPNGRNADGTLNNIEYTVANNINHGESAGQRYLFLSETGVFSVLQSQCFVGLDANKPVTVSANNTFIYYASDTNIVYSTTGSTTANWTPKPCVIIAEFYAATGTTTVSALKVYKPVELAKKQDLEPYLNTMQATNSLISIPQQINYVFANNTVTIKSGSKLLKPDGSYHTLQTDISTSTSANSSYQLLAFYSPVAGASRWTFVPMNSACAGSTDTLAGNGIHVWFDTTNKRMNYYDANNTLISNDGSLPFMIATNTKGTGVTSIDYVFNGIGYIGNTVWLAPGVTGLIPNGHNSDGTLKNIKVTTQNVIIYTNDNSTASNVVGYLMNGGTSVHFTTITTYNEALNLNTKTDDSIVLGVPFCKFDRVSGNITNFEQYYTLNLVNHSEINKLSEELTQLKTQVPNVCIPNYNAGVALAYTNLTAGYTAPSNGIMIINIYPASRVDYHISINNSAIPINFNGPQNDADYVNASIILSKGDKLSMSQTTTPRALDAKFYPFKGV